MGRPSNVQVNNRSGSEAEYAAGLLYAEDSDWVEVSATPDMRPHDVLTLTADGFAQI
jgi:hypothetical protein